MILRGQQEHAENMHEEEEKQRKLDDDYGKVKLKTECKASARAEQSAGVVNQGVSGGASRKRGQDASQKLCRGSCVNVISSTSTC